MSQRARYDRRTNFRPLSQRFLVLVEGEVTEREYFHALRKKLLLSAKVLQIEGPPPNTPKEMIKKAIQRRGAEKDAPYDQVWCVFDAEAKLTQKCREGLREAIELAGNHGIQVALSNPCFELWLVLHFESATAWVASDGIRKRAKDLRIIEQKKILKIGELMDSIPAARKHATGLDEMHLRNEIQRSERNPATTVYKLVEEIFKAFAKTI